LTLLQLDLGVLSSLLSLYYKYGMIIRQYRSCQHQDFSYVFAVQKSYTGILSISLSNFTKTIFTMMLRL